MSVPFVAHTYHTREEPLFEAIHVPSDRRDHRPIRTIAREERVPVSELVRELHAAIETASQSGAESGSPARQTP